MHSWHVPPCPHHRSARVMSQGYGFGHFLLAWHACEQQTTVPSEAGRGTYGGRIGANLRVLGIISMCVRGAAWMKVLGLPQNGRRVARRHATNAINSKSHDDERGSPMRVACVVHGWPGQAHCQPRIARQYHRPHNKDHATARIDGSSITALPHPHSAQCVHAVWYNIGTSGGGGASAHCKVQAVARAKEASQPRPFPTSPRGGPGRWQEAAGGPLGLATRPESESRREASFSVSPSLATAAQNLYFSLATSTAQKPMR